MDLPVNLVTAYLLSFLLHYLCYYFVLGCLSANLHFNSACSVYIPRAKDFTVFSSVGVNPIGIQNIYTLT